MNERAKPEWTPGPWAVEAVFEEGAIEICLDYPVPSEGNPILLATAFHDEDDSFLTLRQAEANARLMAAAPDLLAACRAAFAMLAGRGDPFVGPDWELGHRLSAAIGKATGGKEPKEALVDAAGA